MVFLIILFQSHLLELLKGLRSYILDDDRNHVEKCISRLRETFEFDGTALNHIQLALYRFQEAVNIILRRHNIKPHWMFALDDLVRKSVRAGITVLSPGKLNVKETVFNRGFLMFD